MAWSVVKVKSFRLKPGSGGSFGGGTGSGRLSGGRALAGPGSCGGAALASRAGDGGPRMAATSKVAAPSLVAANVQRLIVSPNPGYSRGRPARPDEGPGGRTGTRGSMITD